MDVNIVLIVVAGVVGALYVARRRKRKAIEFQHSQQQQG